MKTYKDDGVASGNLSIIQSPDKFHEGDQYAGRENGRRCARVSRDYANYGQDDTAKDRRKK
jgi:hypothetical protein